jgi:CelD/BcsL family acetyltransferase involved in cellulose biosynthesis
MSAVAETSLPRAGHKTSAPTAPAAKSSATTARLLRPEELPGHVTAWRQLAASAVVPNPFYEPWTIWPALEHIAGKDDLRFLLVFGPAEKNGVEPLWGLFPLEILRECLHLPIRTLSFWQHRYCALATPLIDTKRIWEVIDTFWRWFERNPLGCHLLDTNYLFDEGPFHAVWADFAIGRSSLILNEFPRCLQAPSQPLETYVSELMSPNHRRDNRRKERRLAELGSPVYHQLQDVTHVDQWVDDFLRLEASGWKGGPDGGAFARQAGDTAYFREVIREGFVQNRVWLMSLSIDRRVIAMKSVFLAGEGGFSFKIAYDESYSKYSPGMLLELQHLRWLFDHPQIKWSDTCAVPRHPLYVPISNERRMICRTLFSDGSRLGDLYVSTFPLIRWIKRQVRPGEHPAYLQISTKE